MRARLVQIGNSRGIRIPKPILEQVGLTGEVELRVQDDSLVVTPVHAVRAGWESAFRAMATRGDDALIGGDLPALSAWDEGEWQWR